jgi:hypothetical protein
VRSAMSTMAILTMVWAVQTSRAATASSSPAPADSIELRGRVVCLDSADDRRECGAEPPPRFALEDRDGHLHRFLAVDALVGIFGDPRVRERDLAVRAREAAGGAVEIIKVYTVKDGTLYDVHYFCEVCHIAAYVPGRCPCCGREMELREIPLP